MIGRYRDPRLVDAQARWLEAVRRLQPPLAERPVPPDRGRSRTSSTGRGSGHPVHAVLTDVPIGALTVSIVADLIGQPVGADVAMLLGVLAMVGAAVTASPTTPTSTAPPGCRATVHGDADGRHARALRDLARDPGRQPDRSDRRVRAARHRLPRARARRARSAATSSTSSGPTSTAMPGAAPARSGSRSTSAACPTSPKAARRSSRPGSTTSSWSATATRSSPSTPSAPTPAGRSPRARSSTDQIQCPWHGSRFHLADRPRRARPRDVRPAGLRGAPDRGGRLGGTPSRRVT